MFKRPTSPRTTARCACLVRVAIMPLLLSAQAAMAGYEVPEPQWAPPTNYYNSATGTTAATLKSQLNAIISAGFVSRSYGDSRYAMEIIDRDPANPANILLVYNRASIPGTWDAGATWNREHLWPKHWLNLTSSQVSNSYKGVASDLFELRPSNPSVNSSRNDDPYGDYPTATGTYGRKVSGYWYPGDTDSGDVARSLFYMVTRYTNLTLVNGSPTTYQMGDLDSLLHWNYTDGVDNFERRRNQYIYGSSGNLTNHALNPSYYQGNRNPYIDHPEYVWAVFGGGNNNSQIYVGSAANADGSSATTVDLGRAIVGSTLPTGSVVVNKTGANPTTFDLSASGLTATAGSALQIGTGQPFDYNNVTKTLSFALSASTATAGVKSGSVTIDNTDLTTGGAGLGSADGNDTVNVIATVVDHATGSFATASTVTTQTLDFGYVPQGFASRSASFAVANRAAASGYTADLALSSVSTSGSPAFATNATTFGHLAAGFQNTYSATLNTSSAGTLSAIHTFNVSDEAIPGAAARPSLGLTMTARVLSTATFPASGFIQLNTGETYDTGPSSIAAGVTLTKTGPGILHVSGPQTNGAGSSLVITGGSVVLSTDAGDNLAITIQPGGRLQLQSPQHLASLATANAPSLVDLLTHPLTLASADPNSLRQALLTGVITSTSPDADDTRSIGYIPSGPGYLLQFTFTGDANLDGRIDPDDYALIDRGMAAQMAGWSNGDFDYSGTVDFYDYLLIDKSFGVQSGTLSPAFLADREARFGSAYVGELIASVPEPSITGLIGALLLVGLRRPENIPV